MLYDCNNYQKTCYNVIICVCVVERLLLFLISAIFHLYHDHDYQSYCGGKLKQLDTLNWLDRLPVIGRSLETLRSVSGCEFMTVVFCLWSVVNYRNHSATEAPHL